MKYDFQFDYIWEQIPNLMEGLMVTLQVSILSIALALLVGLCGAIFRLTNTPVLSQLTAAYVSLIRNTPLLVQLFFIFYGLASIGMGLSLYWSGVLTLVIWGGAYNTENIRGGFKAIPSGLVEASEALGMRRIHYILLVAVPLGMRVAIPAALNTSISVLKNSAILQVVGVAELTHVAMDRIAIDFRTLEMFAAIGVIYLVLVLTLSASVRTLEVVLNKPFRTN